MNCLFFFHLHFFSILHDCWYFPYWFLIAIYILCINPFSYHGTSFSMSLCFILSMYFFMNNICVIFKLKYSFFDFMFRKISLFSPVNSSPMLSFLWFWIQLFNLPHLEFILTFDMRSRLNFFHKDNQLLAAFVKKSPILHWLWYSFYCALISHPQISLFQGCFTSLINLLILIIVHTYFIIFMINFIIC